MEFDNADQRDNREVVKQQFSSDSKSRTDITEKDINFIFNAYVNIIIGLSFSPFSRGLLVYAAYTIIGELVNAHNIKCKYDANIITQRITLFILGFGAFLIGRAFIVNDKNPFRSKYETAPTYEEMWWSFNEVGDY